MGGKERFYYDIMALHPEVTGSCILVIVHYPDRSKKRFIVDCGLFQEEKYSKYNEDFPFDAENIDFCIVTHNHVDHTGRLPLLVKNGFKGNIYTSVDTKTLLPLALYDSYKVLSDMAKRNHTKNLYSDSYVATTLQRVKPVKFAQNQLPTTELEYCETVDVDESIKITMLPNGHLPGAAVVLVSIRYPGYQSIDLMFTGDFNSKNMFFDVPDIPEAIKKLPLTIVQESTYGTTDSSETIRTFEKNVLDCINNGGTAVNMVFSLGRMQEVLYTLKVMQDEGKLSTDIPIYVDGSLGQSYTQIYLKGLIYIKEEMQNFLPQNVFWVNKLSRSEALNSVECKIVVTTSGMGNYGPAPQYIIRYIRQGKNLIQFTGYTAEGTLGARLKEAENGDIVKVGGMFVTKQAKVEYTTEFSAHAKADEIIAFLQQFENLKLVLVNHGETEVKEEFAKRIVKEVNAKDVGILDRSQLYRVGPYGFVKSMSTRFS